MCFDSVEMVLMVVGVGESLAGRPAAPLAAQPSMPSVPR